MPTAISPISIPSSCRSATTASTIAIRSTAAIPATDWRGLTPLDRLPAVRDPRTHWLYNANDAPWRAAGAGQPARRPLFRATWTRPAPIRAATTPSRCSAARAALTPEGLRAIAYDPWMPFFDDAIPALVGAWTALPRRSAARAGCGPVRLLRGWDPRWGAESEATTLASFWAEELWTLAGRRRPRAWQYVGGDARA